MATIANRGTMIMIQIKEIRATELNNCLFIINSSFATIANEFGLTEQNCPMNPAFMKIDILQNRYDKGYLMFGLYERGQLVGYVSLSKEEENVIELHNLAVLPEYRHKGYGKQLLDFSKTKAKELYCNKVKIDIIEENTILKNWYLKNGFTHMFIRNFDYLPFTVGFMECIL